MQTRMFLSLLVALVPACAVEAYTPPARPVALDSPIAPHAGGTDVQGELGKTAAILGPSLADGNVRVRHAVSEGVVVEAEAGMMREEDGGTIVATQPNAHTASASAGAPSATDAAGSSRDAYTGRLGVMLRHRFAGLVGALSAGIGGGHSSTAGSWGAVDVGASLALASSRWIRPWVGYDVSANRPTSPRQFVVSDGQQDYRLELAPDVTSRWTLGLELGPPETALLLGLSVMDVRAGSSGVLNDSSAPRHDSYLGAAAGFRVEL